MKQPNLKQEGDWEDKVYSLIMELSESHHQHYFREDMSVDIQGEKKRIAKELISIITQLLHDNYERAYQDCAKRFRVREEGLLEMEIKKIKNTNYDCGWSHIMTDEPLCDECVAIKRFKKILINKLQTK